MSDFKEIPIDVTIVEPLIKPSDRPVMGERRLVRMLPVPPAIPGGESIMRPAIWVSPYKVYDNDLKENVRIVILLLNSGPPSPDIIALRVPVTAIDKFPLGPVEW